MTAASWKKSMISLRSCRATPSALRGLPLIVMLVALLAGCEGMTTGQKGAATGAALGTGIAMVAGGGLATTVGAGLIGGAAGYLGGSAIGN
jgi:hypothetical protein